MADKRTNGKKIIILLAGILWAVFCLDFKIYAADAYRVVIEDDANLLSAGEEAALKEQMRKITVYGNAAFKSINSNSLSAESYAQICYQRLFAQESGILLLIDMSNRELRIYCDGRIYKTVNSNRADSIADNIYGYASKRDYYTCAFLCFAQTQALLESGKIIQPMKYICNGLLAMIVALLFNFVVVNIMSRLQKTEEQEILDNTLNYCDYSDPQIEYVRRVEVYSPQSAGGGYGRIGGSGGRGHFGSGHSGGGHSGGGHRF